MSRILPEIANAALWDFLRTESLEFYESNGEWPTSDSPAAFASHLDSFIAAVFEAETAQVENRDDHTFIQGQIKPQFGMVAAIGNVMIRIGHMPCGEITLITSTPFVTVLHTKCFVRQFAADWGESAN